MKISNSFKTAVCLAALVLLTACGGGSGGGGNGAMMPDPDPEPMPEPEPQSDNFSVFVIEQFGMTSDKTDPESVDNRNFAFDAMDNQDAFDELLDSN